MRRTYSSWRLANQRHVNLEAHNQDGNRPLYLEIRSRSRELLDLLLRQLRARASCKDKNGKTPLWLSTGLSCHEVTERLPEKGMEFHRCAQQISSFSTSSHLTVLEID
jgi:hypothetical protein